MFAVGGFEGVTIDRVTSIGRETSEMNGELLVSWSDDDVGRLPRFGSWSAGDHGDSTLSHRIVVSFWSPGVTMMSVGCPGLVPVHGRTIFQDNSPPVEHFSMAV
eukprot:17098_1